MRDEPTSKRGLGLGSFLMSYSESISFLLGFHGRYFSELVSSTNIANLFSQPRLCKYLQNGSTRGKSGENVNAPQLLFSTKGDRDLQKKGSSSTATRSH